VPELAVIVSPTVMLAAVLLADSVNILVPVLLTGLNEAVTPAGTPGGIKVTVLVLKPPEGVIVIMQVPLEPGATVRLLGDAEMVKLGATVALTVRLTVAV